MAAIGFVLFLLGGAAMDSERLFIPIMMILAGIAILYKEGRKMAWTK